jgi:serine acetyltransferase
MTLLYVSATYIVALLYRAMRVLLANNDADAPDVRAVPAIVGTAITYRATTGLLVGGTVGDTVGLCDGTTLGATVGDGDGRCDGLRDGLQLGAAVGVRVGRVVGTVLGS